MDRLIYTAMTGANQVVAQQATVAHNLANVSTSGFRAQIDAFRAVPIPGAGLATRTQVQDDSVAADFAPGAIQQTGRELDMAIQGPGWFAVQGGDGAEAYTRNGALRISENGLLQTQRGQLVLGDGGPITIPPDSRLMVGADGTLSFLVPGVVPAVPEIMGRIKLVNPPADQLVRGDDGLFRTLGAAPADADDQVVMLGGALEASNVSVVDAMVRMINLGRQFDTQMALLKNADGNASKADQILGLN
ncbi:MAG: flagellar basal-body rod protein FlgF [Pseudomonadota bacterium]